MAVYFQVASAMFSGPSYVRVLMRLSGAQSPFARAGCYPSRRDLKNLVGRHYPAFVAPTDSCADPKPSSCLGIPLVHQVFAGCCQPLLGVGPSRRYLCESFPTCLDPYPGGSCAARTRFFAQDDGLRRGSTGSAPSNLPTQQFQRGTSLRGCSHSLMFRPVGLLATPIAPTAVSRLPVLP
jgi:hypothetical protein